MSGYEEVEIILNPDGTIQTDAKGFVGKECMTELDFLHKLGHTEVEHKGEYYKRVEVHRNRVGQG